MGPSWWTFCPPAPEALGNRLNFSCVHVCLMRLIAALTAMLPLVASAEAVLSLAVGAWPPYIDFAAPGEGSVSQTVKAAFAQTGTVATLQEVSWKAAEVRLNAGTVTSFAWIKSTDRLTRWRFSAPICANRNVIVSHAERPFVMHSPADLKGQRVGWSRGYSYGDAMDALRSALTVEEMPNDEVALRQLLNGRIDAMPMDITVARQLRDQRFSAAERRKLVIDPSPARTVSTSELHLVCGVADAECARRVARFNAGLKAVQGTAVGDCARQ